MVLPSGSVKQAPDITWSVYMFCVRPNGKVSYESSLIIPLIIISVLGLQVSQPAHHLLLRLPIALRLVSPTILTSPAPPPFSDTDRESIDDCDAVRDVIDAKDEDKEDTDLE
jgi:hypothetical protein